MILWFCPACCSNYSVPMFNLSYVCQNHPGILDIIKIKDSHFPVQTHCPPVSPSGSCSWADDPTHSVLGAFLCQSDYTSHTKTSRTGREKRIRWLIIQYWPTNYMLFKKKKFQLRLAIDFKKRPQPWIIKFSINEQMFIKFKNTSEELSASALWSTCIGSRYEHKMKILFSYSRLTSSLGSPPTSEFVLLPYFS